MRNIPDGLLSISVLISMENSSGSGFLYNSEKYLYLVTAKHVLYDEAQNLRAQNIEITCQTTLPNDEFRIKLNLQKLKPKYHKKTDIAVIRIASITELPPTETQKDISQIDYLKGGEIIVSGTAHVIYTRKRSTKILSDVLISNDVYVFGYPTSIGIQSSRQFDSNKPLIRKGIVANVHLPAQTIILDCPVYGGNSGGPVIEVFEEDSKKKFKLIGVVSEYIPFVQRWRNNRDRLEHVEYLNSGYSVAVSFECVLELISEIEK